MPTIFLTPSASDQNLIYDGQTAEEYQLVNQIADIVSSYLVASNIQVVRRSPTPEDIQQILNSDTFDAYVSLQSSSSPINAVAGEPNPAVLYYPTSSRGEDLANLIASSLTTIYPQEYPVEALAAPVIEGIGAPSMPAVLIELGFQGNPEHTALVAQNAEILGRAIAFAIAEYFNVLLVVPGEPVAGTVNAPLGSINIRSAPSFSAPIIGVAPNDATVSILGRYGDWFYIEYVFYETQAYQGYVRSEFVTLNP